MATGKQNKRKAGFQLARPKIYKVHVCRPKTGTLVFMDRNAARMCGLNRLVLTPSDLRVLQQRNPRAYGGVMSELRSGAVGVVGAGQVVLFDIDGKYEIHPAASVLGGGYSNDGTRQFARVKNYRSAGNIDIMQAINGADIEFDWITVEVQESHPILAQKVGGSIQYYNTVDGVNPTNGPFTMLASEFKLKYNNAGFNLGNVKELARYTAVPESIVGRSKYMTDEVKKVRATEMGRSIGRLLKNSGVPVQANGGFIRWRIGTNTYKMNFNVTDAGKFSVSTVEVNGEMLGLQHIGLKYNGVDLDNNVQVDEFVRAVANCCINTIPQFIKGTYRKQTGVK
jgi:hypothetical protein